VVVYDDQSGANAAARMWWLLKAVGHEAVQLVDGGLPALQAAGLKLSTEPPAKQSTAPYPVVELTRPSADIEEVDEVEDLANSEPDDADDKSDVDATVAVPRRESPARQPAPANPGVKTQSPTGKPVAQPLCH